jgi:hypothetical protein
MPIQHGAFKMEKMKTLCNLRITLEESQKEFLALPNQDEKYVCKRCSRVSNIKERLCRGSRDMSAYKG